MVASEIQCKETLAEYQILLMLCKKPQTSQTIHHSEVVDTWYCLLSQRHTSCQRWNKKIGCQNVIASMSSEKRHTAKAKTHEIVSIRHFFLAQSADAIVVKLFAGQSARPDFPYYIVYFGRKRDVLSEKGRASAHLHNTDGGVYWGMQNCDVYMCVLVNRLHGLQRERVAHTKVDSDSQPARAPLSIERHWKVNSAHKKRIQILCAPRQAARSLAFSLAQNQLRRERALLHTWFIWNYPGTPSSLWGIGVSRASQRRSLSCSWHESVCDASFRTLCCTEEAAKCNKCRFHT